MFPLVGLVFLVMGSWVSPSPTSAAQLLPTGDRLALRLRVSDLDRAIRTSSYAQMQPFFERLDSGLPVTVLALGDSITKDHGGCYHRDK